MCMPMTSPVLNGSINVFGRDKWTFCPVTSRRPYEYPSNPTGTSNGAKTTSVSPSSKADTFPSSKPNSCMCTLISPSPLNLKLDIPIPLPHTTIRPRHPIPLLRRHTQPLPINQHVRVHILPIHPRHRRFQRNLSIHQLW